MSESNHCLEYILVRSSEHSFCRLIAAGSNRKYLSVEVSVKMHLKVICIRPDDYISKWLETPVILLSSATFKSVF